MPTSRLPGHLRAKSADIGRGLFEDGGDELHHLLRLERDLAGEQVVEGDADGIEVGTLVEFIAAKL